MDRMKLFTKSCAFVFNVNAVYVPLREKATVAFGIVSGRWQGKLKCKEK